MPGGNTPKPPPSSSSAHTHRRNSGLDSSASASKPSPASKSKPTPSSTAATPPKNRDPNKKPQITKPKLRPENPSPRPVNPNAVSGPRPNFPPNDLPPHPSYGFHMLDRRSIVLADGSVRSYFALPLDYENFAHRPWPGMRPDHRGRHEFGLERPPLPMSPGFLGPDSRPRNPEYWNPGPENSLKRKFGENEREGREDGFERQRKQLLQYGNVNGPGPSSGNNLGRGEEMRAPKNMRFFEGSSSKLKHSEVDQDALKKGFLHFVKMVFETANQKKSYLADGKQGSVPCLACGRGVAHTEVWETLISLSRRMSYLANFECSILPSLAYGSSKHFPDTHSLIMHAYTSDNANTIVDHLAFHKALCVLMGWNYLTPPDNSKAYQNFSADRAEANLDDLIMWPPSVLVLNTITGKGRDGRMEGIGNKAMDSILRDIGFSSGKAMSMYSREGHLGVHTVKFSPDESGLKEALRLSDYFERERRGRRGWAHVGKDDENNPNLVRVDPKTGEKKRVFYGHLATVADLDKVTFEIKKRVSIVSVTELQKSK
ncbi:hypothetical protein CASFOL_029838 [Castilleja foliolosa]|uniref:XS domain-containing protein n=1 Tax=Castilleja foliolosa TaxID=1961234 RepID=A0ABD3CAF0_9LAMI